MPTAGGGLFYGTELTQYIQQFIGPIRPPKWGSMGMYHKAFGNLELGAESVFVPIIEASGRAELYEGKPQDISMTGLTTQGDRYNTVIVAHGFRWNYFEVEAQKTANKRNLVPTRNIVELATKAMRSVIRERIHDLVWAGDPAHGLEGLFSGIRVPQISDTTQVHTLDALAIYNWVRGHLITFQKTSLLTPKNMRLLGTIDLCDRLSQPFAGFGSSPLARLMGDIPGGDPLAVRDIKAVNELEARFLNQYGVLPDTTRDRLVIMGDIPAEAVGEEADVPPIVRRHYHPFNRTAPRQETDFTQTFIGFEATTGVGYDDPQMLLYVDYPAPPAA